MSNNFLELLTRLLSKLTRLLGSWGDEILLPAGAEGLAGFGRPHDGGFGIFTPGLQCACLACPGPSQGDQDENMTR